MSKLTQQELGGWMLEAHDHWQEHRPKMYLFLPEEEGVTEEPEPDEFWELHKEMMELKRKIYQAEADLKGWF